MIRITDSSGEEKFRIDDSGDVMIDKTNVSKMSEKDINKKLEEALKKKEAE